MIPSHLLRRPFLGLLEAMRPQRLPRRSSTASTDSQAEHTRYDGDYGYRDSTGYSYNDPAWSAPNDYDTYGYSNSRMSGYSNRYDVGGDRRWEGDGYYGGTSSRYNEYSSSAGDAYRDGGGYPEWDNGDERGYGNYRNYSRDNSEGQHSNYRSQDSGYMRTSNRNSYRRNTEEQRRRYHSRPRHNGYSEPNLTPNINTRLFQLPQQQDSFLQLDLSHAPPSSPFPPQMGPSEEYLKTSLEASTKTGIVGDGQSLDVDDRTVVRKLLVLDLNGTLLYRNPPRSALGRMFPRSSVAGGSREDSAYNPIKPSHPEPVRKVHPRPYLSTFLQYLFHPKTRRWLDTMVWSSAKRYNVENMLEQAFGEEKEELVAVWARDKMGLNRHDYTRKVQTTKDLEKPWSALNKTTFDLPDITDSTSSPTSSTSQNRNHSAKTTLLLDDSLRKAHLQPYNHLCVKEYDLDMLKRDMNIRNSKEAYAKVTGAISERKNVEEGVRETEVKDDVEGVTDKPDEDGVAADLDSHEPGESKGAGYRKRKRKEKKRKAQMAHLEEVLTKAAEENQKGGAVYDETLLAVVGILDAVKTESNVAAWIRAGGLMQQLRGSDEQGVENGSSSVSATTSVDEAERPRKKLKLEEDEDSSPTRAPSPPALSGEQGSSHETERTGVPLDDHTQPAHQENENDDNRLWFVHPDRISYWAERGKAVLEGLGIEVVADIPISLVD